MRNRRQKLHILVTRGLDSFSSQCLHHVQALCPALSLLSVNYTARRKNNMCASDHYIFHTYTELSLLLRLASSNRGKQIAALYLFSQTQVRLAPRARRIHQSMSPQDHSPIDAPQPHSDHPRPPNRSRTATTRTPESLPEGPEKTPCSSCSMLNDTLTWRSAASESRPRSLQKRSKTRLQDSQETRLRQPGGGVLQTPGTLMGERWGHECPASRSLGICRYVF